MTIAEVKQRLACYRPGIDDPEDEIFADALAAAKNDPALGEWFHEQQEFDSALRGHLKNVDLPAGLLDDLKAKTGIPVEFGDEAGTTSRNKIIRPAIWKRVAAAAAVVVLAFSALNLFNRQANADVEAFRGDMAGIASGKVDLEHKTASLQEIVDWLTDRNAPVYDDCPKCIRSMNGVGCRVLDWNEQKVSLICFKKDSGETVHMFVMNRSALDGIDEGELPLKRHKGLENGGWIHRDTVYLFMGSDTDVIVKDLVSSIAPAH